MWSNTMWYFIIAATKKSCYVRENPFFSSFISSRYGSHRKRLGSQLKKIIADIFISVTWDFFIFILFLFLWKKTPSYVQCCYCTITPIPRSSIVTDSPQRSIAIQKVIWYIQILLHYPIIIIILRVFRHICYGNCSPDGCGEPLPWHSKSVLPRAVMIHQFNLKDHKRT